MQICLLYIFYNVVFCKKFLYDFHISVCSLIMVSILHLLASLVSWIFMIIVSIASIAGTALLWYTYHELKTKQRDFSDTTIYLAVSIFNIFRLSGYITLKIYIFNFSRNLLRMKKPSYGILSLQP